MGAVEVSELLATGKNIRSKGEHRSVVADRVKGWAVQVLARLLQVGMPKIEGLSL